MSYNIHVGVGMDKKLDLPRIAAVINGQRADLVGLQEVDRGVERTGRIDEIAELANLTHMDYAFAFNLKYQGGQYGVAILSRYPIRSTDHRLYLNTREAERRGFIRAEVNIDGRDIIIVEDVVDTGTTLAYIVEVLRLRNPASLEICALLRKRIANPAGIPVRYLGQEIPGRFVVGYGLDYRENFRHLPFIAALEPDPAAQFADDKESQR